VADDWPRIVDAAVSLRRELHRRPEIAWDEADTARAVREQLDLIGIPWRSCAGTGTVATLAPGAPGRHVALRADIDAMPLTEATGVEWSSLNDGAMHACGHDGHTATLLATAGWLRRHEASLPGPVSLLFQPAEEGGHGARYMIEDGALDGGPDHGGAVEVIFGWHNWPAVPFGRAVCPDGAVMSANGTFAIEVVGEGGHASQPEATRDPVLAAAAITVALQQIVARRLPPQEAAVVAVTSIMAPSATTVTPDRAELTGSIRVADTVQRDVVFELITEVATQTARAHGVEAVTTPFPRYGATVNHAAPAAEFRDRLHAQFGAAWHSTDTRVPVMASEDFSYYLAQVPGAFALVGADDGRGHHEPCHSARYDFNDALIENMMAVYARLAGAPVPDPVPDSAPDPAP
jgi:amidohydrolase